MIGFLGFTASTLALVGSISGLFFSARAARDGSNAAESVTVARLVLVALVAANVLMVVGLVSHDFSIAYVAQVGSRATPLLYTVASLWGALEGSILFWAGLLALAAVLLTARISAVDRPLLPVSLTVLFALLTFFTFIVVVPGNPWRRLDPAPSDGPGPNPLLQNHPLMAIHPPLLYIGFTFLAVPFALTIAALLAGRLDDRWLHAVRRWTLGPWIFLTLGLVAGAWWSYAVLGWGGYWAWDPVENVALLPWLTSTAFLHSAMVGERRGALRGWNVTLVVASFALTILATMVTRSGILNSVHSFTQSAIGPLFLLLLSVTIVASAAVVVLRLPPPDGHAPLGTRATAFLVNNVLLVAIAATVLLGTLFPLIVEASSGSQVSVGAPYFERVVGPLALGLIVLVGIGPSLPWGGWTSRSRRRLVPGVTAAAIAAVVLAVIGSPPQLVAGVAVAGFALAQSVWYILERIRSSSTSGGWAPGFGSVVRKRRSLGGLVVHVGVAVMALAIVAAGVGRRDTVVTLRPGESTTLGPYLLTFVELRNETRPDRAVVLADASASGPNETIALQPSLSVFPTSTQAIATPAISAGVGGDLYVTLTDIDRTARTATFRVGLRPFMSWLWLGGGIAALGGLVAAWPARNRRVVRPVGAEAEKQAGEAPPVRVRLSAED